MRLFGGVSAPVLSPLASKWGGTPYGEAGEDWKGWAFLGQLDLSAAAEVLPELGARGLVRIDVTEDGALERGGMRARWFEAPSLERHGVPPSVASRGAWEARIDFERGWTLPDRHADFFAHFPSRVRDHWLDIGASPEGFDRDDALFLHRLGGWAASGLDEPYDFAPAKGAPSDIDAHEMLLRITFDNVADFAWGTNWIYVLVPRADLARGDLSRLTVTAANY